MLSRLQSFLAKRKREAAQRNYRDAVRINIVYLLGFRTEVVDRIFQMYPGIDGAADKNFESAADAIRAALHILQAVITDQVEKLSEADRGLYLQMLRGKENAADDAESSLETLAWMSRMLLAQVDIQTTIGRLSNEDYDRAVSEFIGAAQGLDQHERRSRRLELVLEKVSSKIETRLSVPGARLRDQSR